MSDPKSVAEWNQHNAEFLMLSPCDQEIYIAAVNAGADPDALMDALSNTDLLAALEASGVDLGSVLVAMPPDTIDAAASAAGCLFGF